MNILSALVGLSLVGAAAPQVMKMSLQPLIAQKRAENFGVAESHAVIFAAAHEGKRITPVPNEVCPFLDDLGENAYKVTCERGEGQFKQAVSRSFRLEVINNGSYTNPEREFAWESPPKYSHIECLPNDPWGVMWYNDHLKAGNLDACIPSPAWSKVRYLESNPDDWLYDLSNHGYGQHPDY